MRRGRVKIKLRAELGHHLEPLVQPVVDHKVSKSTKMGVYCDSMVKARTTLWR